MTHWPPRLQIYADDFMNLENSLEILGLISLTSTCWTIESSDSNTWDYLVDPQLKKLMGHNLDLSIWNRPSWAICTLLKIAKPSQAGATLLIGVCCFEDKMWLNRSHRDFLWYNTFWGKPYEGHDCPSIKVPHTLVGTIKTHFPFHSLFKYLNSLVFVLDFSLLALNKSNIDNCSILLSLKKT